MTPTALANNPLKTRADVQAALTQMTAPLGPFFSPGKARIELGATGGACEPLAALVEASSRPFWGLGPLVAGGGSDPLWDDFLTGLKNGTDPDHPEFWGVPADCDQRLVEMAAFGLLLGLVPDLVRTAFSARERDNLAGWLGLINRRRVVDNNWLFFGVLVNVGLKKAGLPYDQEAMTRALDRIEEFALPGGWYSDGPTDRRDYYVPFALHYYGLIYSRLMDAEDPVRCARLHDRARCFAADYLAWFAEDGSAVPFGRSLTYRFAQGAFWSALAFAGVDALAPGVLKGLVLRHLRWWMRQPVFDNAGVLSVGYAYPNLTMTEYYNHPGSPYWAFKTFLVLALPETHPFWAAAEEPLPRLPETSAQPQAHLVLTRPGANHVVALGAGQNCAGCDDWLRHGDAKYHKFAYSTAFGFSVPSSSRGPDQGAWDSMLALSDDGVHFRGKEHSEESRIEGDTLVTRWKPWADVEIETWLVPLGPWHGRVHRIRTGRPLWGSEGGFALARDKDFRRLGPDGQVGGAGAVRIEAPWGFSGLANLAGDRKGRAVAAAPNTNLLEPRTLIPFLEGRMDPGTHLWACAVLGSPDSLTAGRAWETPPVLADREGRLELVWKDRVRRFPVSP